ncbi:MAG: hypothetical protein WBX25_00730 [Rhodomicrobium sp.]
MNGHSGAQCAAAFRGLTKNKQIDKRGEGGGTAGTGKAPIAGAVSRKDNVVARVIENVKGALLCTDQWKGYNGLGKKFRHSVINHVGSTMSPAPSKRERSTATRAI